MATTPWFRLPREVQRREQDRTLREWVRREVTPFSRFWRDRIAGIDVTDVESLARVPVATEADLAGAGGPGNPALLLSPTEDQFKANAPRGELFAAARQAGGRGTTGRREAIWHRYKAVHIHEAGVDRLLAIAYTRADLDLLHLAGARFAEVVGWGAEDALLNLVPSGPSVRHWALYHAALATRMTALHPRGAGQAVMGAAQRGLAMLPASIVALPTDEAESTLDGLLAKGTVARNLRQLLVVGSPPDAATRVRLATLGEKLAGRPVTVQAAWAPEASRVLYGEQPPAANDPPEATYGLLSYPDLEVLSVRDPATGATVVDGGPGELVITSSGWRGTALVRYATGSWVAGLEEEQNHPVSGATVPRLAPSAVDGAWQPAVVVDGRTRRPDLRNVTRIIEPAMARVGGRDWSLRVADGRLRLALDAPAGAVLDDRDLARRVGEACGLVPDVVRDPAAAAERPRLGRAG